ncbi:unnamed protein product [Strongylus vulgaris]|uniref:SURP motif domain-containing protein n=1 Tax=Strongylus vulgaris TaxID=40348 RepID=A0A3P7IP62_STRVU|nr:unnamed protein product [Strongylus vulgaris]
MYNCNSFFNGFAGFVFANEELRNAIERLAVFVAKNGPEFEKMTMEKQEGNPKFAFLYGGPFNEYYRFCVDMEIQKPSYKVQQLGKEMRGGPPPSHPSLPPHPGNGCPPLGPPPPVESEIIRRMNTQKEQLRQQITDSERNLKAHHDAIPAMKEVAQVAQAVVLSESQKMTQILANVNFDVTPLGAILDQLNAGKCSKDLVSTSRKWIFEHCQTDQLREVVLTYLLSRVKDAQANDNFRLNVLYVINDWAYQWYSAKASRFTNTNALSLCSTDVCFYRGIVYRCPNAAEIGQTYRRMGGTQIL